MALDVEKELKINLILFAIISGIYGLWLLISVETWVVVTNWPYLDPVAGKMLGSILVPWAIIAIKAYKEADQWEKNENTVLFIGLFSIVALIATIYSQIAYNLPPVNILNIIIFAVFAILNFHIYMQKRK